MWGRRNDFEEGGGKRWEEGMIKFWIEGGGECGSEEGMKEQCEVKVESHSVGKKEQNFSHSTVTHS